MPFSAVKLDATAVDVKVTNEHLIVTLADGRELSAPLAWFPRLLHATPAQRERVELSRVGLHWDEIDEDISVAGLLAGRGDVTRRTPQAV